MCLISQVMVKCPCLMSCVRCMCGKIDVDCGSMVLSSHQTCSQTAKMPAALLNGTTLSTDRRQNEIN